MLTPGQLAQARWMQEQAMRSTLRVCDYAEGWDQIDGVDVPRLGAVIYEGKGRLQRAAAGHGVTTAGGVELSTSRYAGALPWSTRLTVGQTVQVLASDDPHVAGQLFRIVSVEHNALALTARRFAAELIADLSPRS